jgi:hypothetical protein
MDGVTCSFVLSRSVTSRGSPDPPAGGLFRSRAVTRAWDRSDHCTAQGTARQPPDLIQASTYVAALVEPPSIIQYAAIDTVVERWVYVYMHLHHSRCNTTVRACAWSYIYIYISCARGRYNKLFCTRARRDTVVLSCSRLLRCCVRVCSLAFSLSPSSSVVSLSRARAQYIKMLLRELSYIAF